MLLMVPTDQTRSLEVPIKGISHLQAEAAQEAETVQAARPELEARVVEDPLLVLYPTTAAQHFPIRRSLLQKQLLTSEEGDHLLLEEIPKKQQSQPRSSSSQRRLPQYLVQILQSKQPLPSHWSMSLSFSQKIQILG